MPETEKIKVNLGFAAHRTDCICAAIRQQLRHHSDAVRQVMARGTYTLGPRRNTRVELEDMQAQGEKVNLRGRGLTRIAPDVTPELARATIESIVLPGALDAILTVKAALADRLR